MRITRYYISQFDPVYEEKFWSGERFTRLIDLVLAMKFPSTNWGLQIITI